MASADLTWLLIKNQNRFLKKGLNGVSFSAEPGNLYNLNTFKHSGLANGKTVHVVADTAAGDMAITISKKTSKQNKPTKHIGAVTTKKSARQALKAIAKDVKLYRPDLADAAVRRLSAVHKSLRVRKAGVKK